VALIALDASVLIALLDGDDKHHHAARAALEAHAEDDLRIPAHTLARSPGPPDPCRQGTRSAKADRCARDRRGRGG